jgi:glycosyltransferase involved in cell wall biosynthesis
MKIAYFTESLPPLTDGVARTFTRLAETLNARKMDFRFFAPVVPMEAEPWRGRVIHVPSVPFPLYRYYRVGIPNPFRLDAILNRFRPDLIQVAAPTPMGIYAQNYAQHRRIPCVSSYHTHFVDYFPYYRFKWAEDWGWDFMRWFYNRSRFVFAPTQNTIQELEKRGFKGLQLWPRGIDRERFSPRFRSPALRKKLGVGKDKLLLFVGRMVQEKGLDELCEAALLLRKKGYRFHLAFAGDGPYRKVMEKRLPQAHYFGFIQGKELSELYASSDLFVFPSTTETFGNVVLEAFASGLPAVAADQGGSADLVRPGVNGLLAKPLDGRDFSQKIRNLLDHPRMTARLRQGALHTASLFNWPAINGGLLNHCRSLLKSA